jgi:hypothetical protein
MVRNDRVRYLDGPLRGLRKGRNTRAKDCGDEREQASSTWHRPSWKTIAAGAQRFCQQSHDGSPAGYATWMIGSFHGKGLPHDTLLGGAESAKSSRSKNAARATRAKSKKSWSPVDRRWLPNAGNSQIFRGLISDGPRRLLLRSRTWAHKTADHGQPGSWSVVLLEQTLCGLFLITDEREHGSLRVLAVDDPAPSGYLHRTVQDLPAARFHAFHGCFD